MSKIEILKGQNVALVLDGFINGLGICRSLKLYDERIKTVILVDKSGTAASYSKYVDLTIIYVDQINMTQLITQISTHSKEIVYFPCSDTNVRVLEQLNNKRIISFESLGISGLNIFSKIEQQKIALISNIAVPKSQLVKSNQSIDNFDFPVIIKPDSGINAPFKAEIANNIEELNELANKCWSNGCNALISEYISGDDTTLYTFGGYAFKGNCISYFTGHKISQKPKYRGVATIAISKKVNTIEIGSKEFLKQISFSGIFQIEYKYCEKRRKYYFIEFNPRNWSWGVTATHSGRNLPAVKWNTELGVPIDLAINNSEQNTAYYFWLEGFISNLFVDKWPYAIIELIKLLFNFKVKMVPALFKFTDPLPFIICYKNLFLYFLGRRSTHR